MPDQSLIVDRASSAVRLSDRELETWAASKRVFVSSVIEGMEPERREVVDSIVELGAEPVWFEEFGGRDQDPEEAYLAEVAASDIFIGILGSRYGRQDPDTGYSATHAEYLQAIDRGLRISVWVMNVDDMAGHQRDFVNEVRTYFTTETVDGPEQLGERIAARLRVIAAEGLAPWCKVANIIFRANEISDDGTTITVMAGVRDDRVAHALTALRSDAFTGHQSLRVVFGDTAATTRVSSVESVQTAGATRRVTVTLTRENEATGGGLINDVSYRVQDRTYSPDELTEIAIRKALFDEPVPFEHGFGATDIDDPMEHLYAAEVTEESLRPILRLLLVESLVASGRASRITKLLVGPKTRGTRRLFLEWEPPPRYGQTNPTMSVEGHVSL